MRYLAQIFSFFIFVVGSVTKLLGEYSSTIDDGITSIAGIIGIIGGIVWLSILRIKMRNEKLDEEIKKKQLENLENYEI